ncbi:LTA synthase family protein [Desulfuromonas acetoxidans]|uniref:LTA synthase family protein n=1 Tax=Desulfuromonas acetoxidans TaxID=891 RepID=UPI0029315389|nr:LTA synthase family protein [Desulfuromonas acetoxidans]
MNRCLKLKVRGKRLTRQFISHESRFILKWYLVLLGVFGLQRAALLAYNHSLTKGVDTTTLLNSFVVGLRFDLATATYLLAPLFLLLVFSHRSRRMLSWLMPLLLAILIIGGIAELNFYREFESRYNSLVFEYLSHPFTVGGMVWDGYPVVRHLLVAALVFGTLWPIHRRILRSLRQTPAPPLAIRDRLGRTMGNTLFIVLMVFAMRGGFQHEPLRWGDAFFSEQPFANHLALNGMFTLGRTAWDQIYSTQESWTTAMKDEEALKATRQLVLTQRDTLQQPDIFPLLRQSQNPAPLQPISDRPPNVVVILMESFAGRMVGALGQAAPITPDFDQLAKQGVLFTRAFSNGTHTHQGVYASMASWPNLPGYEYLMKMMEANQAMSCLPELLKRRGYQTLFLYNGEFSWDNKEGFFRQHGMEEFIGRDDYVNPYFVDPVWGVSDIDVFRRANAEFRERAKKGPFCATILTLSNHSPFNLPDPLPFTAVDAPAGQEGRYNAMRFSDWSLGEFFRLARQEAYFDNTLFVITGDHGFASAPMVTSMNLSRFHVPLLFYAPAMLAPQTRTTVASQVDIVPSILGLLSENTRHQSWGRNLFALPEGDGGFAMIKPSGGEERVALIEDNYLLQIAPKEKPRLYRYQLGSQPSSSKDLAAEQASRVTRMSHQVEAYVETAILSLRQRIVGVPQRQPSPTAIATHPTELLARQIARQ